MFFIFEKGGEALLERPLDKLKLCAIYIEGMEFKGQHLLAALGVTFHSLGGGSPRL